MRAPEYFQLPDAKTPKQVSDDSGISLVTIKSVARGMRLEKYHVAKKVSDAIGKDKKGNLFVTVAELCEE